jgi:hypothetical protein
MELEHSFTGLADEYLRTAVNALIPTPGPLRNDAVTR